MIKVDVTKFSLVVHCTACSWRALCGSRSTAWVWGRAHERNAHGEADGSAARNDRRASVWNM